MLKNMVITPPVSFLKEKVEDLRTALFFNTADSPVAIQATGIVRALEMDDEANIRFHVPRRSCLLPEDISFPARLEFYQKGKPFYLRISGIATVEEDIYREDGPPEANARRQVLSKDHPIVVALKAESVEYGETSAPPPRSFYQTIASLFV